MFHYLLGLLVEMGNLLQKGFHSNLIVTLAVLQKRYRFRLCHFAALMIPFSDVSASPFYLYRTCYQVFPAEVLLLSFLFKVSTTFFSWWHVGLYYSKLRGSFQSPIWSWGSIQTRSFESLVHSSYDPVNNIKLTSESLLVIFLAHFLVYTTSNTS